MKEVRYFFVPDAASADSLSAEESVHAVRALRMAEGDEIFLIDGKGSFFRAEITVASPKHCLYKILEHLPQDKPWQGNIHLAIAPTKMMERMEWMAEKATEVGFDGLTFLECRNSERKQLRAERIERIVVSATKQSRKAWMPRVEGPIAFQKFIESQQNEHVFIAHCYDEIPRVDLFDTLKTIPAQDDVTLMIGPEGDFSIDEVQAAVAHGAISVSLGQCRLRTETAGLSAVMISQLLKRKQ